MKVVLQKCFNYNLEDMQKKIKYSLAEIGALNKINENSKVFIKLNCVGPFASELAITTHPMFVKAVIRIIKEKTNHIMIGDNPATRDIIHTLKKCGIYDIIQEENVTIFDGSKTINIENLQAKIYHSFDVSKDMIDQDVFINLPKLKTHTLTYLTCAEKNLFGLIYGLNKSGWHVRANTPLVFGEAINDLYGAFLNVMQNKLIVHICDGITGLEKDGPSTGGSPKNSNVILTSYDAISLDRVACEVVHLDYKKQFINVIANERKYGIGNLDDIDIVGDDISSFNTTFIPPKNSLSSFGLRLLKKKFMRNILLEHPKIDKEKCIRCGECNKICPPKAMQIKKGEFPHLKNKQCIRCWCCAEVCPQNAIKKSKRPIIGKIILK